MPEVKNTSFVLPLALAHSELQWPQQSLTLNSMFRLLFPIIVSAALGSEKPNIIVILADDHRYDFLSCHPKAPDFLETPNLDRMARKGAHLKNAFVTTSLCSPSRASILTGQYMHHHRVIDNQRAIPEGTRFYSEYLQISGYRTAMIGKWHMGHDNDEPRKGFHHWVSFQGQGSYFDQTPNINGERHEQKGYTADRLTDQAIAWLNSCLLYTSPSPRDPKISRMPSSA